MYSLHVIADRAACVFITAYRLLIIYIHIYIYIYIYIYYYQQPVRLQHISNTLAIHQQHIRNTLATPLREIYIATH